MKDLLCRIPYRDIALDRTYTNIAEYFLRDNRSVSGLLFALSANDRIAYGECSDFELLSAFLKLCKEGEACDSAVFRTFSIVVNKLIGCADAYEIGAHELWTRTSEALIDESNKLRASIASSGLESVGVPLSLNDEFNAHFVKCGSVRIAPVLCPFGTDCVSFDTINAGKGFDEFNRALLEGVEGSDSCAAFLNDFEFEKPNEYMSKKAYEKRLSGQSLDNKEKHMLASQLLRMTAIATAECNKELMIFLPFAPNVRSMGAAAELVEYLDGCVQSGKLNITVFGGDAVSLCMAQAITSKKYKKITAVTGLCGNGSNIPDVASAKYWGCGASTTERYASLSPTSAILPLSK